MLVHETFDFGLGRVLPEGPDDVTDEWDRNPAVSTVVVEQERFMEIGDLK